MNSDFPAILDACVLAQAAVRDTLLRLSERRLFLARWSEDIIAEVERTLAKFNIPKEKIDYLIAELQQHFPDALVATGYKRLIESMTNDKKDRHVVAAAVKGSCEVIVTYNLKHFKEDDLKPFDVVARHPDEFLIDLYYLNPEIVVHTLHQQGTSLKEKLSLEQVLDILRKSQCTKFSDLIAEKLGF